MRNIIAKVTIGEVGIDNEPSLDADKIFSDISESLAGVAIVEKREKKPGEALAEMYRHKVIDVDAPNMVDYLLVQLTPDDFNKLGRRQNDLMGITFGDMESIGKPIPMGGAGGTVVEFGLLTKYCIHQQ